MIFYGKLIGIVIGAALYGPVGLILGLVLGHVFDNGLAKVLNTYSHTAQVREMFFRTVFQTMGCLAKADGVVSENEVRVARDIMLHDFSLNKTQMLAAIQYFNEGKQPSFDLGIALNKFKVICNKHPELRRYFLELEVKASVADKVLWPAVLVKLKFICMRLNLSLNELEYQLQIYKFSTYTESSQKGTVSPSTPLKEAYVLLGVKEQDDDNAVKQSYRRLMSKYHPDKLVAKGLPVEMMTLAKEKAQKITAAYDVVMRSRS